MYPNVEMVADERVVDEGHIITSAGVSAGIDMSLHVVSRLFGADVAAWTARQMEYNWIYSLRGLNMYTVSGTLTPTPPFDFDKSLNFLGVFMPTKQEQTVSSHTLTKAISIDGQTIVFQLISIGTTEKPGLEYTLFSKDTITEAVENAVTRANGFLFELTG